MKKFFALMMALIAMLTLLAACDGEDKKEFIAGIDMREYFIPDYYI